VVEMEIIFSFSPLTFSYNYRHPPSCVSPDARGCTLYLTQLGGFVSRQRQFFLKREKLGYSRHYIAVFTHLKVRALLLLGEFLFFKRKIFLKKVIYEKELFLKKKNFQNKIILKKIIFIFRKKNPPS
jgi:hypothetical protein